MRIAISVLRAKILATLTGKGFTEADAHVIADYLLWADMSGNKTQGIIKLTGTEPLQDIRPLHAVRVERDTKLSQLIDAGANPAPLVSGMATDVAIAKAEEHGFGLVGVHNYFSSNGAQAYYAERIAKRDLIGIVLCSQSGSVAPFNTIEPIFGTNPIGFAFPTLREPLTFDMSTSIMTWYGLVLAQARGERIPDNMAIDKNGTITTDAAEAMDGALLPFDTSYKGSGLSMVIEILAGPLVGAAFAGERGDWGALFMAIDPELLLDRDIFKQNCTELIRRIKAARTKDGAPVRLPGERALAARQRAIETNEIDIDDAILHQLGYVQ